MRVHIYTPSYFPDLVGMSFATDGHAAIFSQLGWEVTVMVANVELGKVVATQGRNWRAVGTGLSGGGLPWNPVRGNVHALIDFTRSNSPDLILIEGWYTAAAALIPKFKSLGLKVVMASHGSAAIKPSSIAPKQFVRAGILWGAEKLWIPKLARQLDAALVLSNYRDNERFNDLKLFKNKQVPQFLAPNFSPYPFARRPKTLKSQHTLLHIGEMRPEKGQSHGVEILSKLDQRFNLVFVFPSENGYSKSVMQLARTRGVANRIHLVVGRSRNELQSYYDAAAALLILSPLRETQPIVAIDGLTRAVPFVSTDVGCMREMEGGIVGPLDRFSDYLEDLCSNADNYHDTSKRALSYAKSEVSREKAQVGITTMLDTLF